MREETGVSSLKVKHNNVLGYFIEVPAKQADRVPTGKNDDGEDSPFIHRQTMANAMRFFHRGTGGPGKPNLESRRSGLGA